LTGAGPGRAAGFGLLYVYRCRGLSSGRILFVLTVVVLLLLAAEGLVRGRVGRAWMAIRGMDVAAETIGVRRLRANLLARL
jgi:ABC-type branched-subunit amino acid transport system permease subunit